MKPFISVVLAVVLVCAVGGSMVNGTMASFFDTEVSTENWMCAGNRLVELSGGPLQVNAASPSTWYEHEIVVTNAGTLGGIAWLHVFNVRSIEDEPGAGDATAEPELVAEAGGQQGQVELLGLGIDCGDDTLGPAGLEMANFVDIEIRYDEDGDEANGFEKEVVSGKLADIECDWYELGLLPSTAGFAIKKGSWGTYYTYVIGPSPMETTLVAGKHFIVGRVYIETKEVGGTDCLVVTYNTNTGYQWPMDKSHLYVNTDPPTDIKGWGHFPYVSEPDNKYPGDTMYDKDISDYIHQYTIPLATIGVSSGDTVCIAAHAEEKRGDQDTAWAIGVYRKLLIRLHFPDIDEDDLIAAGLLLPPAEPAGGDGGYFNGTDSDIAKMCWDHWPTNAYMGDKSLFDIEVLLKKDSPSNGCNECKGKVTQLTLQYNGSETADIVVEQKGKNGGTVFDGFVEAEAQFTFTGMDKNGTLGTEISIYVNGELNTKIHTSCSKPIGPGLVSGAFEVIEGYSKDGGLLCPIKLPPGRRR